MLLVVLPVVILSLSLYLFLTFFGNHILVWILSAIFGAVISFVLIKRDLTQSKIDLLSLFRVNNLPLVLTIIAVLLVKGYVLSPVIKTVKTDNFEHIVLTDVGDYYKNNFVTFALKENGIPPKNPYFPSSELSYYYGYYLIPAFISKVFNIFPNWSFFIFSLIADFIGLLLILEIITKAIKKFYLKILALLLVLFGAGVDIIPFVFNTLGQVQNDQGLQLINNYKALLFVPQHFFAASVTTWVIFRLLTDKLRILNYVFFTAFIFLCSTFVFLTFAFWSFLLFIFTKNLRFFFLKSAPLILLILLPYLLSISGRGNLLYLNHFDPYPFTNNFLVNTFYTFFVKYGPLIILLPLTLFITKTFNLKIFLGIFVLIGSTWFIRSPIFNDFSMRTLMPVQLVVPIILIFSVQTLKNISFKEKFIKGSLLLSLVIILVISLVGFYLEYSAHWRNRTIMHPTDSEILLKVRSLPNNLTLSAIEKNRWVELIPSLSFKNITNPYLYDSYNYIQGKGISESHGNYEAQSGILFTDPTIAPSIEELISVQNKNFSSLNNFFTKYPTDKLILSNKLWVKKDTNPWKIIFSKLGVSNEPLTANFTLFDYPQLLEKTKTPQIFIDVSKGKKEELKDRKVLITKGLSYLVYCSDNLPKMVKIEFEDYYLLANTELKEKCLGKIFYLENEENILLTINSSIDHLHIFPVEIKN